MISETTKRSLYVTHFQMMYSLLEKENIWLKQSNLAHNSEKNMIEKKAIAIEEPA